LFLSLEAKREGTYQMPDDDIVIRLPREIIEPLAEWGGRSPEDFVNEVLHCCVVGAYNFANWEKTFAPMLHSDRGVGISHERRAIKGHNTRRAKQQQHEKLRAAFWAALVKIANGPDLG
jgi:hypothetical protein